jgi:hypothetical protein
MELHLPQPSSADSRRSFTSGHLRITSAPATAQDVVGKHLLGQALTVAGAYTCDIDTYDWSVIEVWLKPSAVSGTFAPTLARYYANNVAVRTGAGFEDAGSNFAGGTEQVLSLSDLNGAQKCRLSFTIPGGGSLTFANTTPATPTSVAEFNGL